MRDEVEPQRRRIARARGKMVIAPAAGGEALEFQMAVARKALRTLLMDVAAIVEDANSRELCAQGGAHLRAEALVHPLVVLQPVGRLFRIEPVRLHRRDTFGADAIGRQDDVEEDARRLVITEHLARLFEQFVAVRLVVETKRVPCGAELLAGGWVVTRAMELVCGAHHAPLGMDAGIALVPLHRDVDRALDVGGVQRPDHVAHEVGPRQLRVRRPHFGRVVGPAMVALGKDGDRVDGGILERRHEHLRIERSADARDVFRGMEIEMDLTEAQRLVGRGGHSYSLLPVRESAPAAN